MTDIFDGLEDIVDLRTSPILAEEFKLPQPILEPFISNDHEAECEETLSNTDSMDSAESITDVPKETLTPETIPVITRSSQFKCTGLLCNAAGYTKIGQSILKSGKNISSKFVNDLFTARPRLFYSNALLYLTCAGDFGSHFEYAEDFSKIYIAITNVRRLINGIMRLSVAENDTFRNSRLGGNQSLIVHPRRPRAIYANLKTMFGGLGPGTLKDVDSILAVGGQIRLEPVKTYQAAAKRAAFARSVTLVNGPTRNYLLEIIDYEETVEIYSAFETLSDRHQVAKRSLQIELLVPPAAKRRKTREPIIDSIEAEVDQLLDQQHKMQPEVASAMFLINADTLINGRGSPPKPIPRKEILPVEDVMCIYRSIAPTPDSCVMNVEYIHDVPIITIIACKPSYQPVAEKILHTIRIFFPSILYDGVIQLSSGL